MDEILFTVGEWPIHVGEALAGFGALALVLLLAIAIVIARSGRRGAEMAMAQAIRADELEERLSEMLRAQSESTGRVDAMAQALVGRQSEMTRAVNERLDSVTHRVGQSMEATTRHTMDSLRVLHERLGIIDNAHKNLTDLTSQVTTLRDVLANKQSRAARSARRGWKRSCRTACRRALTHSSTRCRPASGRIAWCSCPTSGRSASTPNSRWRR